MNSSVNSANSANRVDTSLHTTCRGRLEAPGGSGLGTPPCKTTDRSLSEWVNVCCENVRDLQLLVSDQTPSL